MIQICGTSQRETLIIALATLLFMCCANPNPSEKWRAVKETTSKIIEPCLSYVTAMNVNNRHTVAVLANSDANELYNNAFIRRIINSTNLLIISNKDRMPGNVTRNIIMAKNFTLNRFHHRLGRVRIFFLEISSLSSLLDKLQFMTHLTAVFDSRGCFIVWLRNDFKDSQSNKRIAGEKLLKETFSILWKFYIYNAIVVTCKDDATSSYKDPSMANCAIYTWFPYQASSLCGENTQNFIEVDRCKFMPNDNGGAFYVNYLNSSWRQIYDNGLVAVSTTIMTNDSTVPPTSLTESQRNNENCHVKSRIWKSCNNDYYIRNYFKWESHGVFEFRKINDKDNHDNNDGKIAKIHGSTIADNHLPKFQVISSEFRHFFNKIPSTLNGCKFRTVLLVWPPFVTPPTARFVGMEHKLFLDLSRFMDFRLVDIYIQRKDQAAVSLTSNIVEDFDADLAFGNLYPSIERYQVMDHSIGYFYEHINWVVPLARDRPVWLNLIHCFGLELWILVVVVATTFTVVYARICQVFGNESFSDGVLDSVTIAVASKPTLPKEGVIRLILIIWIFYCFHINLIYQVELMAVLTNPILEKQISKPSEIISSGVEFGFSEDFAVHLMRINNTESKYFMQHNRQCTFETCIQQMRERSFATIGNRMYIQHEIAFKTGGSAKIFVIPVPVAKSFMEMYMKKGFPLRDKLNYMIRRMVEIGYLWGNAQVFWFLIRNITIDKPTRTSQDVFLNLEHFAGAFILLGIGCSLSIVAFIIEYLNGKKLMNQRIKNIQKETWAL